jgi:hypothetical protein
MEVNFNMKTNFRTIIYVIVVIVFILSDFFCFGEVKNEDKPAIGEYVFPMEQEWQVDSAGDTPFGNVVSIPVSQSGYVYCRDLKNKSFYIFDSSGKYIGDFGVRGEGPGEVKDSGGANVTVIGDKVLIQDIDKIHFYSREGKYIHSIRNSSSTRPAALFLTEDEFISAPTSMVSNDSNAKMKYVNLKTGQERVITDFTLFKGGVIQRDNTRAVAVIPTITPVMVVGRLGNKLYFGMNDQYKIYIMDMDGKEQGSFSLNRKRTVVTLRQKEDYLLRVAKGLAPDDVARQLAKVLPDEETYFSNIESKNGMLYIYRSHFVPGHQQQVDIFSSEGKYLYRGFVRVNRKLSINAGPIFQNSCIYMVLENQEGEITLNKYKTVLPH